MKKTEALDAEYRSCSHFPCFSSQWIFLLAQAKGLLLAKAFGQAYSNDLIFVSVIHHFRVFYLFCYCGTC